LVEGYHPMRRRLFLAGLLVAVLSGGDYATTSAQGLSSNSKVLFKTTWVSAQRGWTPAGGAWKQSGGHLAYRGDAAAVLVAPYRVTRKNYAVEAAIRLVTWTNAGISENNGFGILLRAKSAVDPQVDTAGLLAGVGKGFMGCDGSYSQAVVATADVDLQSLKPKNDRFHPGSGWHRYRVQVRGNAIALVIDGHLYTSVTTARSASATRIGLFSLQSRIEVKNFTVYGL
jgi:hypothetical protein